MASRLKTKMTCVPGGQWEVRKKIYPMIKQLFEENGIEFARPTVKVAGNDAVDRWRCCRS